MGALFKKQKPTPVQPPAPMPDVDDPALKEAQRQSTLDILSRSGRSSTILTPADEKDSREYSRKSLGGK
jgi:hypothetical protein